MSICLSRIWSLPLAKVPVAGASVFMSDPSGWESTLSLCTEYGASRPQCVDRTASKMTWADQDGVNDRKQNGVTHVNEDGCQSAPTLQCPSSSRRHTLDDEKGHTSG